MKKKPPDTAKCFGFYAFMFSMEKQYWKQWSKSNFIFFQKSYFSPTLVSSLCFSAFHSMPEQCYLAAGRPEDTYFSHST